MIGYILTIDQFKEIQHKHFSSYECFSCVQDINDVWFTFFSDQQIPQVEASQYAWVLLLPEGEYTPPPFPL